MAQAMNAEYLAKENDHETRLAARVIAGESRAMDAVAFPIVWPRPVVRKSEIPLFFGYMFYQNDLDFLFHTSGSTPKAAFCENGEEACGKWALASWFYENRILEIAIPSTPAPVTQCVPRLWFHPLWLRNKPELILNSYEVQLHRLAETGDIFAQNMLLCAAYWPLPNVTLEELELFSHATVIREDYLMWATLARGADSVNPHAEFDKWEMAYWLYELINKLPALLCLPIVTEDGFNLGRANEIYQCIKEAKWSPGGYISPFSKEAGYNKLAKLLGISTMNLMEMGSTPFPAARQYDLDERAAMLDMVEKKYTSRNLRSQPVIKLQDAVTLADEDAMPDVWELQVGLEVAIRSFPKPVAERQYPWTHR